MRKSELERGALPYRPEISSQSLQQQTRPSPPQAVVQQRSQPLYQQADLKRSMATQNIAGPDSRDIRDKQREIRQMIKDSRMRAREQGFLNN